MCRLNLLKNCALVVCVLIFPNYCFARGIEDWPYEKLFRESDLVIIAEAVSSVDTGESTKDNIWKAEFLQVKTTFAVRLLFKGSHKGNEVHIFHYRLPKGVKIANGPLLVSFRMKELEVQGEDHKVIISKPAYLLFLKKKKDQEKDSCYEPVTGSIDPELSIREIYDHLPVEICKDKKKE